MAEPVEAEVKVDQVETEIPKAPKTLAEGVLEIVQINVWLEGVLEAVVKAEVAVEMGSRAVVTVGEMAVLA